MRRGEVATAVLMFVYSFLAMTAYNILRPITRSKFISALGADNLPYVLLAAGILIGVLMQGYGRVVARIPRRWVIPAAQAGIVAILVVFWLLFATGAAWVPVAFYVFGLILGILLISQFWTLANDIYDPREAKRVFGFIGGGASLGGATGAAITAITVGRVGTDNLLLVSAVVLSACAAIVTAIVKRQQVAHTVAAAQPDEEAVGGGEAIRLLRRSRHLQLISMVIGFAAIGSTIIDQQLNMAAEAMKGAEATDAITGFLAQVTFYLSLIGFVVQVGLTSQIHRSLGLGFALLILPVGLGATGAMTLITGALWAPAVARILDTSLRYTIDKTTREVLFLPLPADLKYRAKPFIDVTVDRFAKALGALMILGLIKPWGLNLDWRSLSYASLSVSVVWIVMAIRARAEYLSSFRRSLEAHALPPVAVQPSLADPATVEMLVEELSSPDVGQVLYAIDLLETLEKRHLITPLLLRHDSSAVRARALRALDPSKRSAAAWAPTVERMLGDEDAEVRAAAVHALAGLHGEDVSTVMQRYLDDPDPRVAATAAVVLADSGHEASVAAAEARLAALAGDTRTAATPARREAAAALARVKNPAFRPLLLPLVADEDVGVAREAIGSVKAFGRIDPLFIPGLISLLGHRTLKSAARDALVSGGQDVLDALAHFLNDPDEDPWVRRHIPATLARVPVQRSMDALIEALTDQDGFLRFKILTAIEKLRRDQPSLACPPDRLEALVIAESARYYNYLTLQHNLVTHGAPPAQSLLVRALNDKLERTLDRIYRLLGLIYVPSDVGTARYAIAHGNRRARAAALEYLDNLIGRSIRRRVMPILEDSSIEEKVRYANTILRSRPRNLEETLVHLIHDDDQVVAAAAIHFAEQHQHVASLTADLEYILQHRPASQWQVFEAASWALAAHRLAERRWDLWLEPLPAVEIVNRLREIPLFDFVSVDELFRIAASARQVRHEPGREVYHEGEHADSVQFLLEGTVRLSNGDAAYHDVSRPAALAFEETLEGSPLRHSVRAADRAVCLSVARGPFLTMLGDSMELAQGLFRMLLDRPYTHPWRLVHRLADAPLFGVDQGPACSGNGQRGAGAGRAPLQPIEKVNLLRRIPLFSRAMVIQLADLAALAREVPLVPGAVIADAIDEPAIVHVVSGEMRLDGDGIEPLLAGPGSTIGVADTLAGVPLGRSLTATREGLALRLDRGPLYDVLADHIGLLQGLFSALLRAEEMETASPTSLQLSPPGGLADLRGRPHKSP
jgi:ATP:ADP antiporter, AAA family